MALDIIEIVLLAAFSVLVLPTEVTSHGFVQTVVNGHQSYPGWNPFVDPYVSPLPVRVVRKIPNDGPITNDQDPNLACNTGGENGAGLVATVIAGSEVVFEWTNWPADHLGPVSTYMTFCSGDCTEFDVNGASWFKIDAEGYENGSWASAKLIANNNSWTSTVPQVLSPGQYLMRNEIVALHVAGSPQYYPSCTQINVTGDGNAMPTTGETVGIPGLYDNVTFPDIWTETFDYWPAPGPPVVSFSNGLGSSPTTSVGPESTGTTSSTLPSGNTSPIPNELGNGIKNQCLLVKKSLKSGLKTYARHRLFSRHQSP